MKRWDKVGRKVSGESQWKDNFLAKGRISEILEYKGFRTRVNAQRKIFRQIVLLDVSPTGHK